MASSTGTAGYLGNSDFQSAFGQPMVDPVAWMKAFRINKSPDTNYGAYLQPAGQEFLKSRQEQESTPNPQTPYENPVSDADYLQKVEADLALNRAYNRDMLQDYYALTRRQNLESMSDALPFQALAADIATRRNFGAATAFAQFKDVNLPTAQAMRNLYAQQQKGGASDEMLKEQEAISNAYRAALAGSGGYRGTTFSYG